MEGEEGGIISRKKENWKVLLCGGRGELHAFLFVCVFPVFPSRSKNVYLVLIRAKTTSSCVQMGFF